jgi:hypothetical protein
MQLDARNRRRRGGGATYYISPDLSARHRNSAPLALGRDAGVTRKELPARRLSWQHVITEFDLQAFA